MILRRQEAGIMLIIKKTDRFLFCVPLAAMSMIAGLDSHAEQTLDAVRDRPAHYETLLAADRTQHLISSLYFVEAIGADQDGQPESRVDTHYLNLRDAKDKETFGSMIGAGKDSTLDIVMRAAGMLNSWIDLGPDGLWVDTVDQIFSDQALFARVNARAFASPIDLAEGGSSTRYRSSYRSGLSLIRPAADREDKEYRVEVQSAQVPEPATLALLGISLTSIGLAGRLKARMR